MRFVNKQCLQLREGARIGYFCPRVFRFFEEFAFLNSEVVTSNVVEEVAKGHTAGPFRPPPPPPLI